MVAAVAAKTTWNIQKARVPSEKFTRFLIRMWIAFLACVKPVSTRANPSGRRGPEGLALLTSVAVWGSNFRQLRLPTPGGRPPLLG